MDKRFGYYTADRGGYTGGSVSQSGLYFRIVYKYMGDCNEKVSLQYN